MKKVKGFYKKHETKILIAGGIVLLVVALKHRKYVKALEKEASCYAGKEVISWVSDNKFITLEDAKKALELNVGNLDAHFAIVQKAGGYTGILINKSNTILA